MTQTTKEKTMATKITADKYIYPPRPQTTLPRTELEYFQELGWIAQIKFNGSRCMIKHLPDNTIQLWNRHGERFRTYNAPEWLQQEIKQALYKLGLEPNQLHLLDGELLDQKHVAIKDTIVIWDILVQNGYHQLGTTYRQRYASLYDSLSTQERYTHKEHDLGIKLEEHVIFAENHRNYNKIWDLVDSINKPHPDRPILEGVVLKDLDGTLERGYNEKNNHSWLVRSRVTTGRHNF